MPQLPSKYLSIKIYNILPTNLKLIKSYTVFKFRVNKWMFTTDRKVFSNLIDLKIYINLKLNKTITYPCFWIFEKFQNHAACAQAFS